MRQRRKNVALALSLLATVAVLFGGISLAFGAAGSTPAHTKNLTDNHDGTYTISLDVVGDSEKKPNNINVIVIVDTSGSMTQQRMTAAKNAVNSLARSLYAYNTQSDPHTVEMALVRFATSSSVAQQPTSSQSTFTTAVSGLGNQGNGGTNWESALQTAYGVDFGDNDQTFVVFVSDGNPTFRTTQNGWNDWSNQYQQWGSGQETATNIQRCYTTAVDDAQRLATKVTPANFFTIGAFGNVDRMERLTDDAGSDSSKNYYSASDTAALNQAISDILAKIEMAGIANTEIDDGTTNQVTTTSGEVAELLEVDESSYKYYRSGGTYGSSMQPWADAPKAKLVNGTVEWDLSSVGVLENGVKYTVTFDCYPSQYTYDTIAKLKNGDITYNSLDTNVKKYIVDNGNGNYSLRTNTNASLSWDDTRDDAGQQSDEYVNPDPVATAADSLTINKEWDGAKPDVDSLPLTVMMDGKAFHTATLSAGNNWETSSFISVGIIKNGQALSGAPGHDFSFAELDDTQYRWELDAPTVRPMRIGEDIVMLVKVDEKHPAPADADTYTIDGADYYADSAASGLTATNHRRSNLNLTKAVTGEDAPQDATFPFTLTVNNSKAPATEPTDDTDHNSDYWVWFSIYDTKAGATVTNATVSGATGPNADGYYYAPSGTQITVDMKAGWNLRFTNLPSGSTYTFVEGELDNGFAFSKAELTEGTDATFSGAQTTTGTIQNTGTSYAVKYTNDYEKTNLEITKVWDDANNQDGKRVAAEDFAKLLTLSPAVEGATPTVTDNGNNTYTIKYTDLPRFNNGTEVEYTVTESAIDGYTTAGSPAKDHGTITNKHEPEKTSVKITKVWDDADNQDGIRPDSVSVQLKAGDTAQGDRVTLDASNNWTHTWENLDKYANGTEIAYTADEVEVPARYTKEVTGSAAAGFTVTNKHTPDTLTVEGTKTWDDSEYVGKPGYERPESITVHLTGEVTVDGQTSTVVTQDTTTTEADEWKYSFTDLPKNYKGQEISYKVTEDVPTGYEATVDGYNIKNTPVAKKDIIDPVTLEITKTDKVTGDTLAGAVFTVTDAGGKQVATATTDAEGKATLTFVTAGTYTMKETAPNGYVADPGNWTIVVEQSRVDKVEYNATDSVWNWFYHLFFGSGTDYQQGKMTVTNPPVTTKVTVDKVWDDNNNQDGKRPAELTYTITGKAGNDTVDLSKYDVTDTQTVKVAGDGSASCKWENLPTMYGGTAVTYEVAEAAVDEYTTKVGEISGSAADGYKVIVTNKHEIDKTKVTVTKAWNDNDNADKTRPESVSVTLSADGTAVGDAVTLNEANNWTYTWENLDVNAAGKAITYTVDEAEVPGYAKSISAISGDATTGYSYTITNSNVTVDASTKAFFKKDVTTPNTIKDATFTFSIEAVTEGAPMPANTTGTASYAAGETGEKAINFGKITYTAAGEYKYKITETNKPDGWTATPESVEVTVTVTGDAATGFKAEVTGATIENAYSVQPTTASFPVEKILSVAEGLTAPDITGKYTFTLTAADGTPMPEVKSYTNPDKDGGSVTFGKIEYTAAGTYTYTVTETGTVDGITNDSAAEAGKTVTVTVVDNGDGTLTATPSTDETPVSFTNTYEVGQVTASIPVEKTVTVPEGLTGPTDWKYTITAAAVDGAPEAESMTAEVTKASPSASIGEFTFKKPGTYKYTVTESGENDGITNGTASYDIEIVVTDNSDGTLTAVVNGGEAVKFENAYDVEPTTVSFRVEKELVVPEDLEGPAEWSYTIDVTANDGAPAAETMTGKVDQDTTSITFGEFEFTKPGKYTYTVSETGTVAGVTNDAEAAGKTVTVTVVDNGNGTMTATADSTTDKPLTFTNTYATKSVKKTLSATKNVYGKDAEGAFEFSLELKEGDESGVTIPEGSAAAATSDSIEKGGSEQVSFADIEFTKPGTYVFTVDETTEAPSDEWVYDASTHDITVVVTDDGTGALSAEVTGDDPAFHNTYEDDVKTVSTGTSTTNIDGQDVQAGQTLTYTIDWTAAAGGETADVTVTDTIPANTTLKAGSVSEGGTVSEDGKTITWAFPGQEPGATGTVSFQVTVDEAAAGTTLENAATVRTGENDATTNTVTNDVKTGSVGISKVIVSTTGVTDDEAEFTFEVSAKDSAGNPLKGSYAVKVGDETAEKAFEDGKIEITLKNGQVAVIDGLPVGTTYTVAEKDIPDGYQLTAVNGEDAPAEGTISGVVDVDVLSFEFENTYSASGEAEIPVSKTVTSATEGTEPGDWSFDFTIAAGAYEGPAEGVTVPLPEETTVTLSGSGNATVSDAFGAIEYAAAGTYTYTVTETGTEGSANAGISPVEATKTVTVEVTDNKDGSLAATVKDSDTAAAFENVYSVKTATLTIPVEKNMSVPEYLDGPSEWSYDINVEAVGNAPKAEEMTGKVDQDNTSITFGEFTYSQPGDYQYTVTETGKVDGVTNDVNGYTVKVNVKDNHDGTLTATANYDEKSPVIFTNTYDVDELKVAEPVKVDKWLTGTNLAAGMFQFEIKAGAYEGEAKDVTVPLPTQTKVANDAKGNVVFGEITFAVPGVYHYTVNEVNGGQQGYSYADNTVDVTITVTDNGNGTMSAETTYGEVKQFENSYKADGKAQFFASKTLKGHALEDGQFTFELVDSDGNVIQRKTNNGAQVVFDPISYTQDDLLKASDEAAADDGTSDDTTADDAAADDTATTDGAAADAATDEATDEAATDEATDEAATDEAATDAATDEAATGEAATADGATTETGNVSKAGSPEYDESATFTYTIREVDDGAAGYTYDKHDETVKVTVTDNGDGKMNAAVAYDEDGAVFTNHYEATGEAQFNGIKTVEGTELKDSQFKFELVDGQGNVIETVANGADGSFSFSPIAYAQKDGQTDADTGTFEYTIREVNDGQLGYTYDSHVCDVIVTVTDNNNGTLTTAVEYGDGEKATFNNPYKPLATSAPVTAKKVLEGRDLKADEFTFELRDAEGKVVATATNAASGLVDFGYVSFDEVGTYTFTAAEVKGADANVTYDSSTKTYTVEVVDDGGQLVATVTCDDPSATFTNVYEKPDVPGKPGKPSKPKKKIVIPQTGDDTPTGAMAALTVFGAAALTAGTVLQRRKRK